jgi:hypothetical protein
VTPKAEKTRARLDLQDVLGKDEPRFLAKTVKIGNFLHGSRVLSAGAPEEIRTPDPQIRSLVLYPAELRALDSAAETGVGTGH